MFTLSNGARPARSNVLVVIQGSVPVTSGSGVEDPYDVVEELRDSGLNVLTVGTGAAKADFNVDNFDDLLGGTLFDELKNMACGRGE